MVNDLQWYAGIRLPLAANFVRKGVLFPHSLRITSSRTNIGEKMPRALKSQIKSKISPVKTSMKILRNFVQFDCRQIYFSHKPIDPYVQRGNNFRTLFKTIQIFVS